MTSSALEPNFLILPVLLRWSKNRIMGI